MGTEKIFLTQIEGKKKVLDVDCEKYSSSWRSKSVIQNKIYDKQI